eukprot:TRINITY_DN83720_c0_g1_i1.p1 TRINITY_DN83720_c0_g1~~TRINITY_DN83720_c0_g1_i1.p1  ORF type:complete len:175 (-),score=44.13 TRINITY_DN83720_c0_g1_i1:46-507(-)
MVDKLTREEVRHMHAAFSLFDKTGEKSIVSEEVGTVMRSLGQNPTEAELSDMIREVDVDGNGTIDFFEFLSMMGRKLNDRESPQAFVEAFRVWDKKGNGLISESDLRQAWLTLGETLTEEQVEQILHDAKAEGIVNADGMIDYKAFVDMLIAT